MAAIPLCTHIKADGTGCGSPAISGTPFCFHHSAVKTALGKVTPLANVPYGGFSPIPFVFPEDRASLQINYFLLLQALNEQRVEKRAAELMLRMLRAMDANLGRKGSLTPEAKDGALSRGGEGDEAGAQSGDSAGGEDGTQQEPAGGDAASTCLSAGACAVNAGAEQVSRNAEYREYRETTALHPAGQRVVNLYYQKPIDR